MLLLHDMNKRILPTTHRPSPGQPWRADQQVALYTGPYANGYRTARQELVAAERDGDVEPLVDARFKIAVIHWAVHFRDEAARLDYAIGANNSRRLNQHDRERVATFDENMATLGRLPRYLMPDEDAFDYLRDNHGAIAAAAALQQPLELSPVRSLIDTVWVSEGITLQNILYREQATHS